MKTLSTFAAAAAIAASAALPVAAETKTADPFVSTQGAVELTPLLILGGAAAIVGIAASAQEGNSSSGTTD